jgi:CTP synthase (UTP-ammonia lyase)
MCSLLGTTDVISIAPHTIAHRAYGREEATEHFRCNYGLNQHYLSSFLHGPLNITATDRTGEARIVELSGHPFFVATLFLPQLQSHPHAPHPLVLAYLAAARAWQHRGGEAVNPSV